MSPLVFRRLGCAALLSAAFFYSACAPARPRQTEVPPPLPETTVKYNAYGLFLKARAYDLLGNRSAALEGYRKAATLDSEAVHLRLLLARDALDNNDPREAGRWILGCSERDSAAEVLSLEGRTLFMLGRVSEALPLLLRALRQSPDDLKVREMAAAAHEKASDFVQAAELFRPLLNRPEFGGLIREKLLQLYMRAKAGPEALALVRPMLLERPVPGIARLNLYLLSELLPPDTILAVYRAAAARDSADPDLARDCASLYIKLERYAEAESLYTDLYRRDSASVDLRLYGVLLQNRGRHEEAVTVLRRASEAAPEPDVWYHLGSALLDLKRNAEAAEAFSAAVTGDTAFYAAWINRGVAYLRDGRLDSAEANFSRMIARFPAEADSRYLLGVVHADRKDFARARDAYAKALALSKDNPEYLFSLASANERLGEYAPAESLFLILLARDSTHHRALNYLGYMWADRGVRLDSAERFIRRALTLSPDNAAYLDSYGWVLFRQKKYAEAAGYLEKAAKGDSGDAVIYEHLAETHQALNRPEAALEYWRKVLELDPGNPKAKHAIETLERAPLGR